VAVVAALAVTVVLAAEGLPQNAEALRVLFIGNSLTVSNDLPGMFEAVAKSAGVEGVTQRAIAAGGLSLEDHWERGAARRAIQDGSWTHVVLQQGPSSLPESQALLREFVKKFAAEARARGARVVMYGVWPPRVRLEALDAVTRSYARAAADADGSLVAVGEGWRAAWRRDASLPLYGADDFHPSPLGTYLAALMFVERLTGRTPIGLPAPGGSVRPRCSRSASASCSYARSRKPPRRRTRNSTLNDLLHGARHRARRTGRNECDNFQSPTPNSQSHSLSLGTELLGSWRLGVGSFYCCVCQRQPSARSASAARRDASSRPRRACACRVPRSCRSAAA
jgi:hypothetical protein